LRDVPYCMLSCWKLRIKVSSRIDVRVFTSGTLILDAYINDY
jgi:hypothetical protein